jgi:hypothetical protein
MDGEKLKHLTAAEAVRYKNLEETFGTLGWKAIEEYFRRESDEAVVRGALASTWELNRIEFGIRLACLKVANLAESSMRELEDIADSRAEAQVQKDIELFE